MGKQIMFTGVLREWEEEFGILAYGVSRRTCRGTCFPGKEEGILVV
jgi:hypothetical protein